jgi:acetyltransferase-like isoleucine patch superfamily enzyme
VTQTIKGGQIVCFKGSKIGPDAAIAENVIIRDSDNHSILDKPHEESSTIEIGNHVWIGTNSIILKGVVIGDGSAVAAGSLVNKNVPPGTLVAGIPAKVVREGGSWQ